MYLRDDYVDDDQTNNIVYSRPDTHLLIVDKPDERRRRIGQIRCAIYVQKLAVLVAGA